MYSTVVSSRGQIVIPAEARKRLNLNEGDVLSIQLEDDGRIVIKPQQKEKAKKGIVQQTKGLLADMEMTGAEYVESVRKNSARRLDEIESGR